MSVILRAYQQKITADVRQKMLEGYKRILVVSPCGSGKTALTTYMLETAAAKGHLSIFTVHRRELVKQSIKAFQDNGVDVGAIASGFEPDFTKKIQVASIQTLKSRLAKYDKPKLCYWDEAQFCGAKTWEDLMEYYSDSYHIGLTATPVRLDGKGLGKYFDVIVEGPSVRYLIEEGYLADYDLYEPQIGANTSGLRSRFGDFRKDDVEKLMSDRVIVGSAADHWFKYAKDKKTLTFCASINHSKAVEAEYRRKGIKCYHLDGESPVHYRERVLSEFEHGDIDVISSVNLFSEGLNIPNIECVQMLRPTQSLGLYIQQIGRCMRPAPGKDKAIVLDHVGNRVRHGLIEEPRAWTLKGVNKKPRTPKEEEEFNIKVCDVCFRAQPSTAKICESCGNEFPVRKQTGPTQVDGELTKLDKSQVVKQNKRIQAQARSYEDLVALGRRKGMKNPEGWAKHVHSARLAKEQKKKQELDQMFLSHMGDHP